MQRLPNKVLVDIFRRHLVGPVIIPPQPNDERVGLMAVCNRWRLLVQTSPILWCDVVFLPLSPANPRIFSDIWLQRSQGVPVSIKFDKDFSSFNGGAAPMHTQQFVYGAGTFPIVESIILPCVQRITSLTCTLATDTTIRTFFTIPPGQFLSLERVDLVLVNQFKPQRSFFYDWEFHMFSVFWNLPSLHEVKFYILNWMHPFHLGLPWGQLTSVDLGTTPMPPDIFLSIILMTAYSLTNGRFQVKLTRQSSLNATGTVDAQEALPFQPVVAHVLKKLDLILIHPSLDRRMFEALHAPVLVSMRIELEVRMEGWNPELYVPMLNRMASLQSLSLTPFRCPLRRWNPPQTSILPYKITPGPHPNMEEFLSSISKVRDLDLGLGLQMGSLTLEKFASGELLPSVEVLHCGSVSGLHVLSAVRRRNQLAGHSSSTCPGTSFQTLPYPVAPTFRPITSLYLLVPQDDVRDVAAEAKALRQHQSSANMLVVIKGAHPRVFYHPN